MSFDEAEHTVQLWPDTEDVPGLAGSGAEAVTVNAAGERSIKEVHFPSIVCFLPATPSTAAPAARLPAVLVIPGGGHSALAFDTEGTFVARWLAARGVAAFVLKHRLGRPEGVSPYAMHRPATAPDVVGHYVLDTERAIRLIRSRAAEWGVDPTRLGAMGFSAGGECVSWASMRPGLGDPAAADPVERQSSRPNFQALIYPGRSGDMQPTDGPGHPPAFLCASYNDREDIAEGLAEVYLRYKRAGASAEMHMYATSGHGFGLRPFESGGVSKWPERFLEWMEEVCPPLASKL